LKGCIFEKPFLFLQIPEVNTEGNTEVFIEVNTGGNTGGNTEEFVQVLDPRHTSL
jgi:hypothetical protein